MIRIARYKIEIAEGCISCGNCETTCPDIFEVKDKSTLKTPEIDTLDCAKEAAENCPVRVIHIKDTKTGKDII